MIDTVKTTVAGMGGFYVSMMDWLPDMISMAVGIATLIYLILKIKKEL
jgi:hypothetical protein